MTEIEWFDRRILQFVLMWAPYGGSSDEDSFPQFGMTGYAVQMRFREIITTKVALSYHLSEADRALLSRAWHLQLRWDAEHSPEDARPS